MARIPVVERAVGQDRLARWHRLAGFTSFTLMLAHIGLISWGDAAGRLAAAPATFWALTLDEPGVLLAVAGTACLVMVVVTSVRAARRRLRYESWHLLHLYAYLGVGLALPHQLWAGQDFLSSPVATAYWWTLWAAAVVAVLVWRVGLPVLRTLRHDLRVTSVVAARTTTVWSVYMTGRRLDRLPVAAGQFLIWRFLLRAGLVARATPTRSRPPPTAAACASPSRTLGDGSRLVRVAAPRHARARRGPVRAAHRTPAHPREGRVPRRGRRHHPAAGAGRGPALRARRRRAAAARHRAAAVRPRARRARRGTRPATCAGCPGTDARPTRGSARPNDPADDLTLLRRWVPDIAERDVYVCGPEAWTDGRPRHAHRTRACPPRGCTSRRSGGERCAASASGSSPRSPS